MDPKNYVSPEWGLVIQTGANPPFSAFHPEPLPRSVRLDEETIMRLSDADASLGRLAGSGRLLPYPHLLLNAYLTREAVASSRIEGTQASLTEVFDAAVTGETHRNDIREVQNYVKALEHGIERLDSGFPMSLRLMREMHAILLDRVRGHERTPGGFRTSQNWIQSPDNRPSTARFVPPPVDAMHAALTDWERFAHDEDPRMPALIRCALLHYQFETIHPFLDGNGRLGRLFITLYLRVLGRMPAPLLYLSHYFEQRKSEYYDRLQFVRERGEVTEWLRFFLDGVAVQAADAIDRAEQLSDLREDYRSRLSGSRSRAPEVVDLLFNNPVLTVSYVRGRISMSQPGVANLLKSLEELRIVRRVGVGPGIQHRWFCDDVLAVLDPDIGSGQSQT